MWDIWKMWQVVRFFKKNRLSLGLELAEEQAKEKFEDFIVKESVERFNALGDETDGSLDDEKKREIIREVSEEYKEFESFKVNRAVEYYHKEAVVDRNDFIQLFVSQKCKKLFSTHEKYNSAEKLSDIEMKQKKIEINSTIESCIDRENFYIEATNENKKHLYLTGKGKKFAGIDGLLKAGITELGVTSAIFFTLVFGAVAGYATQSVSDLLYLLWSFVKPHIGLE